MLFHTQPGRSYRALSPHCTVHNNINNSSIDSSGSSSSGGSTINTNTNSGTGTNIDTGTDKNDDNNNSSSNNNTTNATISDSSNLVILPFPFDLHGGVPYYEETGGHFTHRPFINGSAKEVRTYERSQIVF